MQHIGLILCGLRCKSFTLYWADQLYTLYEVSQRRRSQKRSRQKCVNQARMISSDTIYSAFKNKGLILWLAQCALYVFYENNSPKLKKYDNCGEKSILDGRHVGLLGFQSTAGLMEMKCMNGGIACGLCWMESFGRIILLGLFPLTDGLSCDMWRKTAPHSNISSN